jgi:hypothetical protein
MALIKTGGGVASISGSIGGITYSRNRGGPYMRNRSVPVNPNSIYQQAVRGFLSSLTVAWSQTLTLAQRQAWDAYAEAVPLSGPLGDPRNVGGLGMFIRCNVPRLQAGLSQVNDGPVIHTLAALTNPSLEAAGSAADTLDVGFTNTDAWANDDDGALLVYGAEGKMKTINFFKGPYRYAGKVPGNSTTPPTSPATLTNPFPLAAGQRAFIRCVAIEGDGRVSADFRTFAVVDV